MRTDMSLKNLIKEVLREISEFGLCSELNCQYRRVYDRLTEFAERNSMDSYSADLLECFLANIQRKHETGAIGRGRRNHIRRASLLLRDYVVNGEIQWKSYVSQSQPKPESQEFQFLHSRFIDHLRFYNRSENTIQSCKNSVRKFLLFLEHNGCSTLSMATRDMVPSFFQYLLATWSPTSIRTVASNIRSFLSFAEGGERLLAAVPSRCARSRPIIPILSEEEHDALRNVLQTEKVPLRDKAVILLALRTGLRAVDIVGMKLTDVDWVNDTISIIQSKTGRSFKIPLTADVGNALSAYILNERPKTDSPCVFLRMLAPYRPLSGHSACYALLRRAFRHAGIRVGSERKGMHVLRHSVASRMLAKGIPLTTISSVLGHSNKSSTEVYLSTDEARLRECALGLAEIPMNCGGLA